MPFPRSGGGSGAVTSVFTRTGAVTATSGDYTAAQVTNAADESSASTQVFTGNLQAPAHIASGLTGAVAASRYVGATASGSPATGTFAIGDFVIDETAGIVWVCTTAGTPGLWNQPVNSFNTRHGNVVPTSGDYTAAQVTNAADKSAAGAQDFTGEVSAPDLEANGITGAASTVRLVGGNASGAPGSGTFEAGDIAVGVNGHLFVCSVAGSPGTWVDTGQVLSVAATDASIVVGGTASAPTIATGTLDAIATAHPPVATVNLNGFAVQPSVVILTGALGATAASRVIGATASGAPSTGAHLVGDVAFDQTGKIWICTTAGTPGTFTQVGGTTPQVPQRFTTSGTFTPGTSGSQWFRFTFVCGGAGGGAGGSTGGGGGGGGGAVLTGIANITSNCTITVAASAAAGANGNVSKSTGGLTANSTNPTATLGVAGGTGQGNGGNGGDNSRGGIASTVTTSNQQHGLGLGGGGSGDGAATNNPGIGAAGLAIQNPDGGSSVVSYGYGGSGGASLNNTAAAGGGFNPGTGGTGVAGAGGGGAAGSRNGSNGSGTTGGAGGSNTASNTGGGGGGGGAGTVGGAGGAGDTGYVFFEQIA